MNDYETVKRLWQQEELAIDIHPILGILLELRSGKSLKDVATYLESTDRDEKAHLSSDTALAFVRRHEAELQISLG